MHAVRFWLLLLNGLMNFQTVNRTDLPMHRTKKMFYNRVSISQTKGSDACGVRPLLKRRVDDFHFSPAVFEPPLLSPLNRYPRHLFLPELQNCSAFQKGLTRPCRSSGSLFVFYCVQFRKVSRNVFFEPLMSCTRNF